MVRTTRGGLILKPEWTVRVGLFGDPLPFFSDGSSQQPPVRVEPEKTGLDTEQERAEDSMEQEKVGKDC